MYLSFPHSLVREKIQLMLEVAEQNQVTMDEIIVIKPAVDDAEHPAELPP